ncbi:MAG: sugar phosphate isomerase/epimerase [Chloroflexi bacterium]|nr:sugar phosphate isomerase/epimerase [Chloroflexota bacterium]
MTDFSFATSSIDNPASPRYVVEWAIEHGFNGVEFNAPEIRLGDLTLEDRQWMLLMSSQHHLRYTHHFPGTALPGSHDEATRERDLAELISEIRVAGELGVEVVIFHPGRLHVPGVEREQVSEADRAVSLSHFVDFMKAVAPIAEAAGVVIGAENMHYNPGWLIRTHGELADAIDEIGSPAVGTTFDVGHAWGSGGIDAGITTFGDRIVHVQVHDCRGPEGAGNVMDQHLEIGTGVLEWGSVGELMRSKSFIATLEISASLVDREDGCVRSRDVLRGLWG